MGIGELVDGPLWYLSATIFIVGIFWRIARVVAAPRRDDLSVARSGADAGAGTAAVFSRFLPRPEMRSRSAFQYGWGYAFHVTLFLLLLFGRVHVEFYEARIFGFGWAAMPDWLFLLVSEVSFAALLMLLLYRVMEPVTRLLSTKGDYLGSILILLVMLSGCMAMDQSAEPLRLSHLFLAEVLLVWFPFGSLMHAFLFVPSRGFTGAAFGRRGVAA